MKEVVIFIKENGDVFIAAIGLVTSVIIFVLGKSYEKKVGLRKIKEDKYIEFIELITEVYLKETEKNKKELSIKVQDIYLIGDKRVQKALSNYLTIFTKVQQNNFKLKIFNCSLIAQKDKTQQRLYGDLLLSMKKDLYGRGFKFNYFLSKKEIEFTVFK